MLRVAQINMPGVMTCFGKLSKSGIEDYPNLMGSPKPSWGPFFGVISVQRGYKCSLTET